MQQVVWLLLALGCGQGDKSAPAGIVVGGSDDTAVIDADTASPAEPECGNGIVEAFLCVFAGMSDLR